MRTFGFALALVACFVFGGTADAQSTKGAGKSSISIIKWPVVSINQKAAGTIATKPSASVAGKIPTGGSVSSLKLAKDLGDPLKPGFAPGDYVLDIETAATPDGNADSQYVAAFITLSIDPATLKCTVHAADSVNGDGNNDSCTQNVDCAPDAIGKCSFSTYQAAGQPNIQQVLDGNPQATRVRLRKLTNPGNCHTGDIILLNVPVPGTSDCRTAANTVVGVMGVANADVLP